jgi:hypothetical protein
VNNFLRALQIGLVFLRRWVVLYLLNVDVFAFNLLDPLTLLCLVFPVFVELRKARTHVIDEQLGQLGVSFNNEAEELAVVIVNNLT